MMGLMHDVEDEEAGQDLPDDDEGPPLHTFLNAGAAARACLTLDGSLPKCCRHQCILRLADIPAVKLVQEHFKKLDHADQQQWIYNQFQQTMPQTVMTDPGAASSTSGCDPWSVSGCDPQVSASGCDPCRNEPSDVIFPELVGFRTCVAGWCSLLGIGKSRVKQVREAVQAGVRPTPPEDQRKYNQGRDANAFRKVDAFLEFAYQNIAEPLADAQATTTVDLTNEGNVILPSDDEDSGMDEHFIVEPELAAKELKYLLPCTVLDFYDTYCTFERSGDPASASTFRRALKRWRCCLKFRRTTQHAKCSTCAKLQKMRKDAKTTSERHGYQRDLEIHLRSVFMDRAMDARYAKLSQESALGNLVDGTVLSIAMDGMDQAKFKCPRNVVNAKELESLWRPVLHVTGALVEGVGEFYFIAESDSKKTPT